MFAGSGMCRDFTKRVLHRLIEKDHDYTVLMMLEKQARVTGNRGCPMASEGAQGT